MQHPARAFAVFARVVNGYMEVYETMRGRKKLTLRALMGREKGELRLGCPEFGCLKPGPKIILVGGLSVEQLLIGQKGYSMNPCIMMF